jgi:hypothetical protein
MVVLGYILGGIKGIIPSIKLSLLLIGQAYAKVARRSKRDYALLDLPC